MRKYEVDQLVALHREGRLEQLFIAYAAGVERSHQAARARSDHEVRADAGVIEHLEDPGVGEAARAAAAEYECDQGAVRLAGQNPRLAARRVLRRGRQARAACKRKGEEDGKDARAKPAPRAFHTRHFFAAAVIHGSKRLPKATVASKGALLR